MSKKLISSILVVALLNLVGCYSFQPVTVPEYEKVVEKDGKPNEIFVKTKDSQEYHFMKDDYHLEKDTLFGKGKLMPDELETSDINIALAEIKWIQLEQLDWGTTTCLGIGIAALSFLVGYAIWFVTSWHL